MIVLMWLLGCGTPTEAGPEPVAAPLAAAVYDSGMWGERVLTVTAGLDEALGKLAAGDAAAASALSDAVYRGSFEPELEPLIRTQLGRRAAASTEYGFGLLRQALAAGSAREAQAQRDVLVETLTTQAVALDAARAVLTD